MILNIITIICIWALWAGFFVMNNEYALASWQTAAGIGIAVICTMLILWMRMRAPVRYDREE